MVRHLWGTFRAQLRDGYVLLQESRNSLLFFGLIIFVGASIFHFFYTYPNTDIHPNFSKALHVTFALVFFETLLPFPEQWYLQILFYFIPILGLATVAEGVLRFGGTLVSKQDRGQRWQIAMASTFKNHVIVCGIGKVGYRVILELIKLDREVVAIELDDECRFIEKTKELKIPVILPGARRPESILKAGVEKADAIIPCTDDEMSNLDIALDARELNPNIKVVMRMFDTDLARRVERGFGIHTAFSTSALAAPLFVSAAMRVNVKHSFYIGDTLLHLSEVVIETGTAITDWTIGQLEQELDLSVVCHQHENGSDLHPDAENRFIFGDRILVIASMENLEELKSLNTTAQGPRES